MASLTFTVLGLDSSGTEQEQAKGLAPDAALAHADKLHAKGLTPRIVPEVGAPTVVIKPSTPVDVLSLVKQPANDTSQPVSTFTNLVTDATATKRIEALHAVLATNGVKVDTKEQFFATGTRMASEGYATQAARKSEHDAMMAIRDVASSLVERVNGEKREDVQITARELSRTIEINGKLRASGFALSEQAIRGMLVRLDSPSLSFVLGLRNRIAEQANTDEGARDVKAMQADKAMLAEVLRHELARNGDCVLKLRTRAAMKDCYAIVSPSYAPADAPAILDDIVSAMPRDARGTFAYDPQSTAWEVRAAVWTPTPVESQAVGEPFEGYISLQSKDNGTGRFQGGGGINLLRCLNASTYVAASSDVSRRHVGNIAYDIASVVKRAAKAAHALCEAWGTSREAIVEAPTGITIQDLIPGFYRHMLTARGSEVRGVLPGRTEEHARALAVAFNGERRDASRLVRSDLAQGWTKYIQGQPTAIRREAETAIGAWIVGGRAPAYEPASV